MADDLQGPFDTHEEARQAGLRMLAETRLRTISQTWPGKLIVSEENLKQLKRQALQDGVSEEFWDKWVEDCIEVVKPWEGGE